MGLLEKLIDRQRSAGLSDRDMATRLGVSSPMWTMVRMGKANMGVRMLGGVVRSYPDLIPEVVFFLRGDRDKSHISR